MAWQQKEKNVRVMVMLLLDKIRASHDMKISKQQVMVVIEEAQKDKREQKH